MRLWIALTLGLFSFFLFMFVGEAVGLPAAFAVLAVYFFACQFLLSRGHADAHRDDWDLMVALDLIPVMVALLIVVVEKPAVVLSQAPGLLLAACGGTYAGAVVASVAAKRTAARP